MSKRLDARHGVVCRLPGERLGYFGWPTVALLDDGRLVVASSGLRSAHVCPWGKTVLNFSADDGATWSPPRVINDSPIDDRDAGVTDLGGGKLLVSWFTLDTRKFVDGFNQEHRDSCKPVLAKWTDELVQSHLGSWIMLSGDGGTTWGKPIRVPVSAPHGPIRLHSGKLLYLGKLYGTWEDMEVGNVAAAGSDDGGRTWRILGTVPVASGTGPANYHEPHLVELASGRLLGAIRIQNCADMDLAASGIPSFSIMLMHSDDGGRTWSTPRPMGFHGSPPHLLRHSSGTLVLTYGYRQPPFGQRAALSRDDGDTWEHDYVIRDDGPDGDLGYPSTAELSDGSMFTVYYQKAAAGEKCSLLWSRWRLPN